MEYENIFVDAESSYIHQLNECSSFEAAFSFQSNPYSINQELVSSDINVGNFLEMESDFTGFDFPNKNSVLGIDNSEEIRPVHAQKPHEKAEFLAGENSHLKDIEEELMLESSCLTDLLLMGAEAVEAGNVHFASLVAMKLNDILFESNQFENGDNPMERLALYFTQGLLYKSINTISPELLERSNTNAYMPFQILQELSPYVKFAHFTANQAILEATQLCQNQEIQVIDFDIMEGVQWPSLMVDLYGRSEETSLRITAIVIDQKSWTNIQHTGYRLQEFADSINLSFVFDQILITKEEDFERIRVGQTLIGNCMINQLHMPCREKSMVKMFFNGLRKLSPKIMVLVEEELFNFSKFSTMKFVEFFCEAIDHYSALSDSLVSGFCGGCNLALRVIEEEFLRMRILENLKQFPCGNGERNLWIDEFPSMNGFRPIPMSSCNVSQAKHLVSLFNGGYWVQNEHCRLALCWKSRPLTTASIWVPTISRQCSLARSTSF